MTRRLGSTGIIARRRQAPRILLGDVLLLFGLGAAIVGAVVAVATW